MQSPLFHSILVSCEHAGNLVPQHYAHLFTGHEKILQTHRGWDPGALKLATVVSVAIDSPLISYIYSRLLIEPNRSVGHPALYSKYSRSLSANDKEHLLSDYYSPYRNEIIKNIEESVSKGKSVLHLSIHTFTPIIKQSDRNFEIGFLYDPKRKGEKLFSNEWKKSLISVNPALRTRMNKPYLGKSDGVTTFLRKKYSGDQYLGIELEVNQRQYEAGADNWHTICLEISESLKLACSRQPLKE